MHVVEGAGEIEPIIGQTLMDGHRFVMGVAKRTFSVISTMHVFLGRTTELANACSMVFFECGSFAEELGKFL
jgi:hypothetical protein